MAGDAGSVRRWAESAEFPEPLRWGEVERGVLARTLTDADPPASATVTGPPNLRVLVLALGALLMLSAVIGAVAISQAAAQQGGEREPVWVLVAVVAFSLAITYVIVTVGMWQEKRRYGRFDFPGLALTVVASGAAFGLLLSAPSEIDFRVVPTLVPVAGAAAVVAIALLAIRSRGPRPRQQEREKLSALSPEQRRYRYARAEALEAVLKRGLVDRADVEVSTMIEMPLGTWDRLDQPR